MLFKAKDLLKKLLCTDPIKRATLEDAIEHPWFKVCLPN